MKNSIEKLAVRLVVHFLGEGQCKEGMNKVVLVPFNHLEPDKFTDKYLKHDLLYENISYKYHDCIYEEYVVDGKYIRTMFVRYCLDTEKENFKNFIDNIMPGDFAKPTMLQRPDLDTMKDEQ